VLSVDFGVAGKNYVVPGPAGPPKSIPALVWRDGRKVIEEYWVEVHQTSKDSKPPLVYANVQVTFKLGDLRDKLISIVNAKDDPCNEILLITTGLIDQQGYVATTDQFLLPEIKNMLADGSLTITPTNLNQVILHHWNTPHVMVIFERPSSPTLVDAASWQ
jgi:hypothetical protein